MKQLMYIGVLSLLLVGCNNTQSIEEQAEQVVQAVEQSFFHDTKKEQNTTFKTTTFYKPYKMKIDEKQSTAQSIQLIDGQKRYIMTIIAKEPATSEAGFQFAQQDTTIPVVQEATFVDEQSFGFLSIRQQEEVTEKTILVGSGGVTIQTTTPTLSETQIKEMMKIARSVQTIPQVEEE